MTENASMGAFVTDRGFASGLSNDTKVRSQNGMYYV